MYRCRAVAPTHAVKPGCAPPVPIGANLPLSDFLEPAYSGQQRLHESGSKAHSRLGLCLDAFWPWEALPSQRVSSSCFTQPGPGTSTLQTQLQPLPTSAPQALRGGGEVNVGHPARVS